MELWNYTVMARPRKITAPSPAEDEVREKKLFYIHRRFSRAFAILAAEEGPRAGPRLIEEAINLLLVKYGRKPV